MEGLTASTFGLIWVTLVLLSCGQIFLKLGLGKEGIPLGANIVGTFVNIVRAMMHPKVIFGFFLYVVGTFFWLLVLSRIPLSIAFPLFSMSYFLVVILSAKVLKEQIDWKFAVSGLLLISVGVTFIGFSSPKKATCEHPTRHAAVVRYGRR